MSKRGAGPALRVAAIASSSRMTFSGKDVVLTSCKAMLSGADVSSIDAVLASIGSVAAAHLPCAIVDCLRPGSRPAPMSSPQEEIPRASTSSTQSARRKRTGGKPGSKPIALHKATIGAGLPVISTLNDLVETEVEFLKIEDILSGTLSYAFNHYSITRGSSDHKSSDIVKVTKEEGYTEPDPRDELNGKDVAGKARSNHTFIPIHLVTILGRVAGMLASWIHRGAARPSCRGSVLPSDAPVPEPLIVQGTGAGAAETAFGMFSDIHKIAKRIGYVLIL
ncbi:hypothetical protein BC830DRAFT_1171728 [Chytriomyces sp. MP71]|nr:hypothetical protein BC830DRAFT_1171728 [Chytriomyces sp. MP71]